MIRDILKMGDARLLRVAPTVPDSLFGSAELDELVGDMFDTMAHAGGVGLAAPQIGVDLQLVIFGFEHNGRYPDAPAGRSEERRVGKTVETEGRRATRNKIRLANDGRCKSTYT